MISAADLISSISRLTTLAPAKVEGAAPDDLKLGADPQAPQALPVPTLIEPPSTIGETLIGLRSPAVLDPLNAVRGMPHSDGVAQEFHRSRAEKAGTQAAVQQRPTLGARLTRLSSRPEPEIKGAEIRALEHKLIEALNKTPDLYLFLSHIERPDAGADVQSSVILNAAMIPGWPPPVGMKAAVDVLAAAGRQAPTGVTDEQLLEYLTALGGNEAVNAYFNNAKDSAKDQKLLRALIILAVSIGGLLTALRAEVADILNDFELVKNAETPECWGWRIRLRLE